MIIAIRLTTMKITGGLIFFPCTEVEVYVEDCLLKHRINTRFDIKDFSEVNVEVFKITKKLFLEPRWHACWHGLRGDEVSFMAQRGLMLT